MDINVRWMVECGIWGYCRVCGNDDGWWTGLDPVTILARGAQSLQVAGLERARSARGSRPQYNPRFNLIEISILSAPERRFRPGDRAGRMPQPLTGPRQRVAEVHRAPTKCCTKFQNICSRLLYEKWCQIAARPANREGF